MPDATSLSTDEQEQRFLERVYWLVGSFCVTWSIVALACVIRRRLLGVPLLSDVEPIEAIIFTQGAFCLLLPLLLGVIAGFRAGAARRGQHTRFPGVLADVLNVPPTFTWPHVIAFLGLVVLPVSTMEFCYRRMVNNLEMYALGAPEPVPVLNGSTMFRFLPPKNAQGKAYDWRWRGEGIAMRDGAQPARLTAFPGWQPWIYCLVSYSVIGMSLWVLFTPPGTLRRIHLRSRASPRNENVRPFRRNPR